MTFKERLDAARSIHVLRLAVLILLGLAVWRFFYVPLENMKPGEGAFILVAGFIAVSFVSIIGWAVVSLWICFVAWCFDKNLDKDAVFRLPTNLAKYAFRAVTTDWWRGRDK